MYICPTGEYLVEYLRSSPVVTVIPCPAATCPPVDKRSGPHIICDSCYGGFGPGSTFIFSRLIVLLCFGSFHQRNLPLGLPFPHGTRPG